MDKVGFKHGLLDDNILNREINYKKFVMSLLIGSPLDGAEMRSWHFVFCNIPWTLPSLGTCL